MICPIGSIPGRKETVLEASKEISTVKKLFSRKDHIHFKLGEIMSPKVKAALIQGASGAVGVVAYQVFKGNLIVPMIGYGLGLLFFARVKLEPALDNARIHAIALLIGHLGWLLLGVAVLGAAASSLYADIVLMTVGVLALTLTSRFFKPTAFAIILVELFCIAVHIKVLTEVGADQYAALVMHSLIRLGVVICLIFSMAKEQATSNSPVIVAQSKSEI